MLEVRHIAWDSDEGEEARRLRIRVFVDEQKVPLEEEIDAIDPIAYHVLALDEELGAVGTGRLFGEQHDPSTGRIGRMAVDSSARGRNVGAALMHALLAEAVRRGYRRVMLDSQTHAMGFYGRFGFTVCGPEHMDCGIPHRMMEATREEYQKYASE